MSSPSPSCGKATLSIRQRAGETVAHVLVGVSRGSTERLQILRMRTDLRRAAKGIGPASRQRKYVDRYNSQTSRRLWLPSSVKAYVELTTHNGDVDEFFELSYHNEHRYTNYQRYRVSAKMLP